MADFTHPTAVHADAIALLRSGVGNAAVARKLGISTNTVGVWKHRDRMRAGDLPARPAPPCPRCTPSDASVAAEPYSYLLGLYLGDGYIRAGKAMRAKGVFTLVIACADAWPGLMDECEAAMAKVMPQNKINRVPRPGMHEVLSYSKHWPCLFPQTGPGMEHQRAIHLETWQQEIVEAFPREFVRGLLHSDGCRVANWTAKIVKGNLKRYEYPRYHFTNESSHIRDLFVGALDRFGVEWRFTRENCISVAKRASVAALDEFVGPKY